MYRDRWHIVEFAGVALMAVIGSAPGPGGAADQARLALPSGLEAELQEVLRQEGPVVRFRYVAPGFDGDAPLEKVSADLEYLCNTHAAPRVEDGGERDVRIIVSLADAPSEFGVFDPDVAQVFEAYTVENGTCIWEAF